MNDTMVHMPQSTSTTAHLNGHSQNLPSLVDQSPLLVQQNTANQATKVTKDGPGWWRQIATAVLLTIVAILLAVVIAAPIALSSGDLVRWAASPTGLGLTGQWPLLVFIALDAAAFACVLLAIYCAFQGRSAGVFGILVWVFAGFSGLANYRHGSAPGAPADAFWFFPVMSVLGPGLLEAVMHFIRKMVRTNDGSQSGDLPKFGIIRWLPIIGAPKDTFGARRTAQILGIHKVDDAVATYHALCPDGSLKVVKAIRARDVAAAKVAERAAAREAAGPRPPAAAPTGTAPAASRRTTTATLPAGAMSDQEKYDLFLRLEAEGMTKTAIAAQLGYSGLRPLDKLLLRIGHKKTTP